MLVKWGADVEGGAGSPLLRFLTVLNQTTVHQFSETCFHIQKNKNIQNCLLYFRIAQFFEPITLKLLLSFQMEAS